MTQENHLNPAKKNVQWSAGSAKRTYLRMVATKAGASMPTTLSTWILMLEYAFECSRDGRHVPMEVCPLIDCDLGLTDGTAARLHKFFTQFGYLDDGCNVTEFSGHVPRKPPASGSERTAKYRGKKREAAHSGGVL